MQYGSLNVHLAAASVRVNHKCSLYALRSSTECEFRWLISLKEWSLQTVNKVGRLEMDQIVFAPTWLPVVSAINPWILTSDTLAETCSNNTTRLTAPRMISVIHSGTVPVYIERSDAVKTRQNITTTTTPQAGGGDTWRTALLCHCN